MKVTIQKWVRDENNDLDVEVEETQEVSNMEWFDGQLTLYGTEQEGLTAVGNKSNVLVSVILDKETIDKIKKM